MPKSEHGHGHGHGCGGALAVLVDVHAGGEKRLAAHTGDGGCVAPPPSVRHVGVALRHVGAEADRTLHSQTQSQNACAFVKNTRHVVLGVRQSYRGDDCVPVHAGPSQDMVRFQPRQSYQRLEVGE